MKALVTGAPGFLGGALARRLQSLGAEVTAQGRNVTRLAQLQSGGAAVVQTDLADAAAVSDACCGQEVVFHCAALSSPWGPAAAFHQSNVLGTQNVIRGCQSGHVKRLVHVSTPSIYFSFASRLDVSEDAPLPARPANAYAATKLLAEAEIDRAFQQGLPVITIRPRAIFGPGDTSILPRLIDRLAKKRLPIIGSEHTLADLTCVENVVDALLLCARSPESTLGHKYNITNGEPVPLWEMIKKLCAALGYPYPRRRIPYALADGAAALLEGFYRLLPGQPEPPLTRYTVSIIANSTTLDIRSARKDLGYTPAVSIEAGFQQFIKWWKETHP